MEELVVNFWVYVDLPSTIAYNWSARVYCLEGSDDDKLNLLRSIAECDFKTCSRRDFQEDAIIQIGQETVRGISRVALDEYFEANIDWFCYELEKELPDLLKPGIQLGRISQKLPNSLLYVRTLIAENEFGESKPVTKQENKDWAIAEQQRIALDSIRKYK